MKPELELVRKHLSALGLQPGSLMKEDCELSALGFSLAPGIEAECVTCKPGKRLISTTLVVSIDLDETEALTTFALAVAQAIAPVIIFQTEKQLCLRLSLQSEPKYHRSFLNEGIVILRFVSAAIFTRALALANQSQALPDAITSAIEQLQATENH